MSEARVQPSTRGRDALYAVYGAQCAQKDGKTVLGCLNPPYVEGVLMSFKDPKPAGAPETETISR